MPRNKSRNTDDDIKAVKLKIEQAKLAKLEADLPPPNKGEFTRYEDLPPLPVEDRERLEQELIDMLTVDQDKRKKEKHDWYMSMAHWAP